ncbi:MAG: Panacea domain-containing protein [Nitrospirota bacterium]
MRANRFDPEKALNAILWIARRIPCPTFHSISKLLYFADRLHLERYGRLITGDSYVAMKHGPVPSGAYDIMKAVRGDGTCAREEEAREAFAVDGHYDVVPRRAANDSLFSESDRECLEEAIQQYGSLSFQELTDRSHDAAWHSADENDSIELEQIIATLPDGASLLEHLHR